MPNGDLLATAYGWFQEDTTPSTYVKSMNKFGSILLRSKDRGRNWSLVSTIAVDPAVGEEGFNEPVLVRLSQGKHQGRRIALLRTGSNKAKWPNPLYQTESDDEGRTWRKPRPLVKTTTVEERQVLLVAGGSRVGTLYGAYNLLYRLGCRWFAPGEIQEQLPRISKLGQWDIKEQPSFRNRGYYLWEDRGTPDFLLWMARNRMNYWWVGRSGHPLLHKLGIRLLATRDGQRGPMGAAPASPWRHPGDIPVRLQWGAVPMGASP